MEIKNKRVFVSGGAGVIGITLVQRLFEMGAIIMVGDLKPRPKNWDKAIRYRMGDLNYITKEELDEFAPDFFFHLAATFERSTETYGFWEENHWHNVRLSTHLMTVLKDSTSLKKVVFASSYLIYDKKLYTFPVPAQEATSLKETDPISPRNLTGAAKLNHEIELNFLDGYKSGSFQTVSARIYRSYGKNSRDIISRWIRSLLKGEELVVFKKEGIFDYVFAEDVAEGLIRMAIHPTMSGLVNLGRGNARRITEVLAVLKQHFPDLRYREEEIDIPYEASQADMTLCKAKIDWAPSRDIEDTIAEMIDFEKAQQHAEQTHTAGNVLVTSISKKIPMLKAVKKAIEKMGNGRLFGGDMNPDCIGKHFVDVFWLMPRAEMENLPEITTYLKANNIIAVIPSRDGELSFWAKAKELLEKEGISVMVSNENTVNVCIDKLYFYKELQSKGIAAIPTFTAPDDDSVSTWVVKEQFGAGSESLGLNLSKEKALEHAKTLKKPIFQPFIAGKEYSIDVYVGKDSRTKSAVVRSRDLIVNGESQITTTQDHRVLEETCASAAEQIQSYGHLVFQAIVNDEGVHIIECNSRFGGASTLSIAAGLDSFYWFLLEANGENLSQYPVFRCSRQLKQIRYPSDIVI